MNDLIVMAQAYLAMHRGESGALNSLVAFPRNEDYPTIKQHCLRDNVNFVINEVTDEEHMTVSSFIPTFFLTSTSAKTVSTNDKMTR